MKASGGGSILHLCKSCGNAFRSSRNYRIDETFGWKQAVDVSCTNHNSVCNCYVMEMAICTDSVSIFFFFFVSNSYKLDVSLAEML
jgi:hypothetical protein